MMNGWWLTAACLVCLAPGILVGAADDQAPKPAADACDIKIDAPQPGANVGRQAVISGTATVPTTANVWVLISIRGLKGWWPQGGGGAEVVGGRWEVLSFFGQSQDVGAQFVVAAAAVSHHNSQLLDNWVQVGQKTGSYPPMPFPAVVEGCPVPRVTVTKTAH
ncbi:MAG: hypothetical protein ACRD26_23770 [Vicinamibacterales bacterium]